jgi:hypothetical protein
MIGALFGAGLTLAGAYGLGSFVTRRVCVTAPVRLAAGAALLSLVVMALMVVHGASRPLLTVCSAAACVAGLLCPVKLTRPKAPWWMLLPSVIFVVFAGVNSLAPETEGDPNTYHLQPALDAREHHGFARDVSFYERLPQATELLYVIAFTWGGASAAKLVHFAFLLASLPLIAGIGRSLHLSHAVSYGAAGLYFMAPVVQVAGSAAFNDAALVFAVLAALTVLLDRGPAWLAGLLAGFCFSIKLTGGIIALTGVIWLVAQRRRREAPVFVLAAMLLAAPWLARNLIQTGNPFAPFFNLWFPNPYFHASTETLLASGLRSYGIGFWQRFPEVLWGAHLQGIVGPVFVLAPLALFGIRRRNTAILLAIAAVFSAPWWLNAGARFLMLSLPFIALALLSVLPRPVVLAVVVLHAITAFPGVIGLYASGAWRLQTFPWRVAFGFESQGAYLRRISPDYNFAKLVEAHTTAGDHILDVIGIAGAHVSRHTTGSWQSATAENAFRAMAFAYTAGDEDLYAVRARVTSGPYGGIRVLQTSAGDDVWSVCEIQLFRNGEWLRNDPRWSVDANPNPWEAPLAFDNNFASRWMSWQPARPRQYLALDFEKAETLDSVVVIATHSDRATRFQVQVRPPSGAWRTVESVSRDLGPLQLRTEAARFAKKLGFTHIAIVAGTEGVERLGAAIEKNPAEWGVDLATNLGPYCLFRID